jgi:hypothetical protein
LDVENGLAEIGSDAGVHLKDVKPDLDAFMTDLSIGKGSFGRRCGPFSRQPLSPA